MKKILLACGILVVIIIAAIGILFATLDVNQFRGRIQAELQQQLHRPVTLGNMSLSIFPLSIRVSDVQIGEPPSFPTGHPFMAAKEIRVHAELFPLLHKQVHVSSLQLQQPAIELVSNAAHQWNYSDLTQQSSSGGGASGANGSGGGASGASGSGGGGLSLSSLTVNDGTVTVSDLSKPNARSVYEHIDVVLSDYAPGKKFDVKVSAQLPGAKQDSLVLQGSGGPPAGSATPFDGRLTLAQAPVSALAKFAGTTPPVDGLLSGSADIHAQNSVTAARGNLSLERASVHGAAINIPISATYDISDDSRSDILEAKSAKITAGKVVLTADGKVNSRANTIAAAVRTSNANVTDLLALARVLGLATATGSGTLSIDAAASGPLNGTLAFAGTAAIPDARIQTGPGSSPVAIRNGNVKFSGTNADVSAESLSNAGLVLTNVRATGVFSRGVITLSPVSAKLFGGNASGTVTIDTNPDPNALALNVKLEGADANQLLSATSSVKNTIYGSLSSSSNLKLRLFPATDALARSMNGTVTLNLTKGHLAGVNVMNELASIGKFIGYSANSQNLTNIEKLSGDLNIVNGVASTRNLELKMPEGSLAAVGSMDLAAQTLNLKTTAVMDRGTSQNVGGNRIGGFMQTALANSNGELVVPVVVTGTFAHPKFTPDVEQMAQLRLKNLMPTASSPGKVLTNILGGGSKQGGEQQGAQPQQPLGNAVGGALDSLFHKKKQ